MKPSDNNKRIFTPSGCLEKDALLDYLAGKTNAQETRAIELHLVDCPLCSDAVDGLSLMDSHKPLQTMLNEARPSQMNHEPSVFELSESKVYPEKKHTQKLIYIGIAASLALLLVSYFAMHFLAMNSQSKETLSYEKVPSVTEQKENAAAPLEEKSSNEAIAGEAPAYKSTSATGSSALTRTASAEYYGYSDESKNQEAAANQKDDMDDFSGNIDGLFSATADAEGEKAEDITTVVKDEKNKENDQQGWVAEEKTVEVSGITTLESVSRSGKKQARKKDAGIVASGGVAQNAVPLPAQDKSQQGINGAMQEYQKGNYSSANDRFETVLKTDPGQTQATYYQGMSLYYLHQYPEALNAFQQLLKDKKSQYYAAAQWQMAVIYMETGAIPQARKVLNEIIDGNGSYRNPAEEAIKNLGNQ